MQGVVGLFRHLPRTILIHVYTGGSGCPEHTWVAPVPTPAGVNTIDSFVYAGGSECPDHTWWPLSPTPSGVNAIDSFVYSGGSGCPEHTWVAPVHDTCRGEYY
jgi:hypothetical protein